MSGAAGVTAYPDPTTDYGHVLLNVTVIDEDGATSTRVRLTPATAAKLGQRLIDVASWVEQP
jgi:hypothetical protein